MSSMYCDITPHFVGVEINVLDTGRHEPCLILDSEISYRKIRICDSRKIVAIPSSGVETSCKVQGKTATSRYNTKHQSTGEQRVLTDNRPPNGSQRSYPSLSGVRVVDGYRVTAKFSGIDKLLDSFLDRSRWLPVVRVQAKICRAGNTSVALPPVSS